MNSKGINIKSVFKRVMFLLSLVFFNLTCINTVEKKQPNVLFIAVDDLRTELGCYGASQIITPNIDQLAKSGIRFNRAYCNIPVCGASRSSMLTGILPTAERFKNFKSLAQEDAPNAPTLPQVFKEAGYTTLSYGKIFHSTKDSNKRSWSQPAWKTKMKSIEYLNPETGKELSFRGRGFIVEAEDVADNEYLDGKTVEKTIADLKQLKDSDKPFFLACGFVRPHLPFYAPKKYFDLYDREKIELADNRYRPKNAPEALKNSEEFRYYSHRDFDIESDDFHRLMRHGYYASVSYTDKLIGDLLQTLDNLGMTENTIIVLWGDHGWNLGEHNFWGKHNTVHNCLQIPLIFKVPNGLAGKHSESIIESVDIYPTICKLAGIEIPKGLHGQDFTDVLDNPKKTIREYAYSRFETADAVVSDRYAYTVYETGEAMLFDHELDPDENKNEAVNPAYANVLKKMRNYLEDAKARAKEQPQIAVQ